MTPSTQRDLIARLRHEAQQAGTPAPIDLAERIIAGLPQRPQRSTIPLVVTVAAAAAAAVALMTGLWWNSIPPATQPELVDLPTPALDLSAMPDFINQPERPLTGELAALRRDGERLIDFFTEVGAPLRSAINLGSDTNHVR